MARNANQSEDYKFEVIQEPWIRNGKPTGYYGNVRTDTDEVLGMTSEQYGLIQNETLLNAAIAALEKRGMKHFEQKVIVAEGGKRMYAKFTFRNRQVASAVGDVFGYVLILKNSFDRSTRATFELMFERLVCTNGMATLEHEFGLTQKHSSSVNVEFVGKALDRAIEHGKSALQVYDTMAKIRLSDEQGQHVLKHLEAAKLLSGTLRQSMETLWLAPRRKEDKARNLYNLYNAVTDHLSHNVENERFEYAGKVNSGVLFKLYNAARNPNQLSKLIIPVESEVVIVKP